MALSSAFVVCGMLIDKLDGKSVREPDGGKWQGAR
jgi:hypothetical protein